MPDRKSTDAPDLSPDSVRTLLSCPVCGSLLTGKQTVCSPKCRIARSRQRREANHAERDAKVQLLLTEAPGLLGGPNAPPSEAEGTGASPDD